MKVISKILAIFLQSILIFQILFFPTTTHAATCTLTTTPSPVTTNERNIDVEIRSTGLVENNQYWIWFNSYPEPIKKADGTIGYFTFSNGRILIQNLNGYNSLRSENAAFQPQTNTLSIREPKSGGNTFCSVSFPVQQAGSGGTCGITFTNTSYTVNDDISIRGTNLGGNPGDGRRVLVKRGKEDGPEVPGKEFKVNVGELNSGISIGRFENGQYYLEIRDGQDIFSSRICYTHFVISEQGRPSASPGTFDTTPGPKAYPKPTPVCKGTPRQETCDTALGGIATDPTGFIKSIFTILLSLAGGVALLLIILSGYKLMTSQGNPEKVQEAREQLTSAIVGLLFVIFSLTILQIIGVDILRIPGFQ